MLPKILIIDDDRHISEMISVRFPSYNFLRAFDGESGISILSKHSDISLIILDYKLGADNGVDVLKKIKKITSLPSVLMLSGYGDQDVLVQMMENKASSFIQKPIDFKQLEAKLTQLISVTHGDAGVDYDQKVDHVKKNIVDEFESTVTLRELSKNQQVSEKYLSRVFKDQTGQSFTEYRLEKKIDLAKDLLKNTFLSMKEISNRLGYKHSPAFIKTFKNETGITPGQYRKEVKK